MVLMLIGKSVAEHGAGTGGKFLLVGKAEIKTEAGDTLGTGVRFWLSPVLPPRHSLLAPLKQISLVYKTPVPGVRTPLLALTQLFPGAGPQFPCLQAQ